MHTMKEISLEVSHLSNLSLSIISRGSNHYLVLSLSSILYCDQEPSWIRYRSNYWMLSVSLYSISFLSFKHVGVICYWLYITYTQYYSFSAKNVKGSWNFLVWNFQAMVVLVLPSMSSKTYLAIWSVILNSFLTPNLQ